MTQKDEVVAAMKKNGGYATFQQLNQLVNTSTWKTKTPAESIRKIVQVHPNLFFRIKPGLWALKEQEKEVLKKLSIHPHDKEAYEKFTHTYYQGIVVEIGNKKRHQTYVPAQDKNRKFLETKLCDLV